MRRWYLIAAVAIAITGVALLALPRGSVWTTSSDEARRELEAGLDAQRKLYYDEAKEHFEKALKLDPGAVITKLFVAQSLDGKELAARRKELLDEVRKADLGPLSARERFLIALALAYNDKDQAKATAILDEYLAKHPDDPYALNTHAAKAFAAGNWDEAARDYRHLAEVAPNFLLAYNQLGYIAMAQGRFADAETMLKKYRYVAPEQANPHDSLGELYAITGRYREAETEFEEALRVKPGFCDSFLHLVQLFLLTNDFARADAVVGRAAAEPTCPRMDVEKLRQTVAIWRATAARDWAAVIKIREDGPSGGEGGRSVLVHLAYCQAGQIDKAKAMEAEIRGQLGKLTTEVAKGQSGLPALITYLEGQRLLVTGDPAQAAARFEKVDELLTWRGLDGGLFKLFNLTMLIRAERSAGNVDAATKAAEALRSVNPTFAAEFAAGRGMFAAVAPS